jgi:AAA+ superfamily predicted ATPase
MSVPSDPKLEGLRLALAASPENVPLLLLYAESCLEAFQLDEAHAAFGRVLSLEAERPEALLGVARVQFLAGKISEAMVRVEQLVGDRPEFAPAHLLLSRLYVIEGNREGAAKHYRTALQIDPASTDPALARDLGLTPEGQPVAGRPTGRMKDTGHATVFEGRPGDSFDDDPFGPGGDEDEEDDEYDFGGGAAPSGFMLDRERPKTSFRDVGGMEALKEQIRMKVLYPMENPDLFKAYGKTVGGGVLLYGPPGCGKTLISRATAGEIKANFYAIGLHDVLDAFIGESEKRLHAIFESARQNAPAVLFFDEIDALAADRRDLRQHAGRNVINQFLAELDSGAGANDGVLVLGATNAPWHVDSAFRRPGRFDRTVFVPPPDEPARAAIIEILAKGKPVRDLDVGALAKKTSGFSGADLMAVFDVAAEAALDTAMKQGRVVPISTKDLARAAKGMKPSTRAWFESAKNYALYANQDGHYDDVLEHLGIRP